MENIEIVKKIIDQKHSKSNGSCGSYIPDIAAETKLPYDVLNPIFRKLYSDKYIVVREGINGKLIFKA